MKYLAAGLLISLALQPCAQAARPHDWSADLKPAQALLAAGDYRAAYAGFQRASAHNPLAQMMLGLFHLNGWGRAPDGAAACTWFHKAAQRQVPLAQHLWGDCLAHGTGRAPDIPEALAWYEKAAAGGHLISLCSESDYYIEGKGVDKDPARGLALCTQAAQANSPPAMLKLAGYYDSHPAVERNLAAARYWYQQAAQHHISAAQYRLGLMLAAGEGGEPDADAARYSLESAAADGYAPAYLPTARLYANLPVQKDTGALAPEHLAKIYLWSAAAKARAATAQQAAEADTLLTQVLSVMPATWRADLDKQVAQHVAKYAH